MWVLFIPTVKSGFQKRKEMKFAYDIYLFKFLYAEREFFLLSIYNVELRLQIVMYLRNLPKTDPKHYFLISATKTALSSCFFRRGFPD